jgi:hypothetical protein
MVDLEWKLRKAWFYAKKTNQQTQAAPVLQGVLLEGHLRPKEEIEYAYGLDLHRYYLHLLTVIRTRLTQCTGLTVIEREEIPSSFPLW